MYRCDTEGLGLELDLVALSLWLNLMNEGVFSKLNDSLPLSFNKLMDSFLCLERPLEQHQQKR